jgi:hypothetical protein
MTMRRTITVSLLCAWPLLAQTTINGSRTIQGSWDASGANWTKPAKSGSTLPATCSVGEVFFKVGAAAGQNLYFCTATNTWTQMSGGAGITARDNLLGTSTLDFWPSDPRVVWLKDEFPGATTGTAGSPSIGELSWNFSNHNGGNSVNKVNGAWPNLGILQVTTGSTSGNTIGIYLAGSSGWIGALGAHTDTMWDNVVVFRAVDTANVAGRIGLIAGGQTALPGSTGWFGLRYDTSVSDANFQFVFAPNATETAVDSGVPIDSNWHTLLIRADGATVGKVWMSLDGGTEKSMCNSGCDLASSGSSWYSSNNYGPTFQLATKEAAAKNLYIDFWAFRARVGTNPGKRN